MAEEFPLFNFCSNRQNDGLPFWKPKENTTERKANDFVSTSLTAGCCEFIGELITTGSDGRYCSDGTFCPARIYTDAKVFEDCPTRKDKLKTKQGT